MSGHCRCGLRGIQKIAVPADSIVLDVADSDDVLVLLDVPLDVLLDVLVLKLDTVPVDVPVAVPLDVSDPVEVLVLLDVPVAVPLDVPLDDALDPCTLPAIPLPLKCTYMHSLRK
jgi:hypothetical protein